MVFAGIAVKCCVRSVMGSRVLPSVGFSHKSLPTFTGVGKSMA
jgi:hypothetical protein